MRKWFLALVWVSLLPAAPLARAAADPLPPAKSSRTWAQVGLKGMVSSDDRVASEWGATLLRRGGNSVDAAVGTALVMAVTRPHFASLGGGGFLVHCPAPQASAPHKPVPKPECVSLDFREKAPAAANRDFYIRDGKARTDLSQDGAQASGVPGVPAGLLGAHRRWGKLPLKLILSRPIELALGSGLEVTGYSENAARSRWKAMNAEAQRLLGCAGAPCAPGTRIRQPELARVLQEISQRGEKGFYQGWVARRIVQGLRASGGVMTEKDLADYRAQGRPPLVGRYRDLEIVTMAPPSSGGALLLMLLGYSERADQGGALARGPRSVEAVHALAWGSALAFADRAEHFGDPDQVSVELKGLLSSSYLDSRWRQFDPKRAPAELGPGSPEPEHTTHLSVIDRDGGAVALTTTVNDDFGSGFVPPGTGIFMNNQMDDFAIQPGVPNLFGLVGAEKNSVAPGKRPLSSMTPTVVRDASGMPRLVLGAQGGPRIISAVWQTLLHRIRFGASLSDSVLEPRFHQQWKPSSLFFEEPGPGAELREGLEKRGWKTELRATVGKLHALEREASGRVLGVADPRAEGQPVSE
jgi:gamma-glutamyltranspeptidase/glutathione hydrolase